MEEHSKEFLEKLKGLLAFAKEHKNALEHQEIVDYFKGISLTEIQSEKILDYLDEHGVDVLRQILRDCRKSYWTERKFRICRRSHIRCEMNPASAGGSSKTAQASDGSIVSCIFSGIGEKI